MNADLCPRCGDEPVKSRGLGKRCYDQWIYHGKPDELAPPLPPFGPKARQRRDAALALGWQRRTLDGGRATQVVRKEQRIAEYEHLTREKAMLQRDAVARLGVTKETGSVYERLIVARTGMTLIEAHKALFFDLVDAGMAPTDAAVFIGRHARTGYQWIRQREAS